MLEWAVLVQYRLAANLDHQAPVNRFFPGEVIMFVSW